MGRSGWEDETWTADRSSRRSRAENGERPAGQLYNRDPRGYDQYERRAARPPDNDGWDRPRPSSSRDDDWRGSSGGRSGNLGNGNGTSSGNRQRGSGAGGYDRGPGPGGSNSGRSRAADYSNGSNDGSNSRDNRAMRGQRPPARGGDDGWGAPPRNGTNGGRPRQNAGGSGGLWGDEQGGQSGQQRRMRQGATMAPAAARGLGGRPSLDDLRATHRQQNDDDLPEKRGGFTAGMGVLIIFLALLLGAGAGFIYFKISTPAVHADTSGSPASSTATPHSFIPIHDDTARTVISITVGA